MLASVSLFLCVCVFFFQCKRRKIVSFLLTFIYFFRFFFYIILKAITCVFFNLINLFLFLLNNMKTNFQLSIFHLDFFSVSRYFASTVIGYCWYIISCSYAVGVCECLNVLLCCFVFMCDCVGVILHSWFAVMSFRSWSVVTVLLFCKL